MDAILELAERLGKQIREDRRGSRMLKARKAFEGSATDRQLLADYEGQQFKIHELEQTGRPVEPEDKRRLADLHGRVIGSEVIKELLTAQADFLELMAAVSQRV